MKRLFNLFLYASLLFSQNLIAQIVENNKYIENISKNISITMVKIKLGSSDSAKIEDLPKRDFYISQTEITQEQWLKIVGKHPTEKIENNKLPIRNVSWKEANDFCLKLSKLTGKKYELPTQAQWKYVAYEGHSTYMNTLEFDSLAWNNTNSSSEVHPVATKDPNLFCIYDIFGNVWEWCSGIFYGPDGPSSAGYICEGGCYKDDKKNCTNSYRFHGEDYSSPDIGFRIVCNNE